MRSAMAGAIFALVASTDTASTFASTQWSGFVDGNAINTCFPGFVVSYEPVNAVAAPAFVPISHAEYETLSFGAGLDRPMATEIIGPNPGGKPTDLTAEIDGAFVAYDLAIPGESARGFVDGGGRLPAIGSGPSGASAALLARYTPAIALVPKGAGLTQCGFTRVMFVDEQSPDTGSSIQLILHDGKLAGGVETRL